VRRPLLDCYSHIMSPVNGPVWAPPIGMPCDCLGIFGGWALVRDADGRLHAVSAATVEPAGPDAVS
jgi:hypothetical protein